MDEELRALLKELETFGREHDARAASRSDRMLNITPDTGGFLALLIRAMKARKVLELGTSNGYSTLWLAYAVRPMGGSVTTVELSSHKAEMARANFARAGLLTVIQAHVANAGDFLRGQAAGSFEFVFLDSERSQYVAWWGDLQRVLAPGSLVVVDNAVSHADELEEFVQRVRLTDGFMTCLAPVGHGEFLALKGAR